MGLIVCVTFLAACAQKQDPPVSARPPSHVPSGDLRVEIHANTLTLHAHEASLRDVVEEIARRGGLVLVLQDSLDERVTVKLEQLPLGEALRQILRDRGFALQQAEQSSNTGGPSDARAGRLWIFSKRSGRGYASPAAMSAESVEESDALDADEAIATLSGVVADGDADARLDAVSTLAEVGSDQAVAVLVTTALNDADSSVREDAVFALGGIGGDTGNQVLRRALTDTNREVRKAAIEALEDMGGDRSAQSLAVALNDTDVALRAAAVDALGEIGGDTAIRLLQQASTDNQSVVREAAAERLAGLRIHPVSAEEENKGHRSEPSR